MASLVISEKLYRCLVSTILNSTPDSRVDCQPNDLLKHIKIVFDFHEYLHEDIVEEESLNRPEYDLHVQSLEARDINWTNQSKPYCILSVNKKGDISIRSNTPPGSPSVRRKITKSTPFEQQQSDSFPPPPTSDQYTSCLLDKTLNVAQWNEEFHFNLGNDLKQFLKVYVLKTEPFSNVGLKIPNSGSTNSLNRSPASRMKSLINHVLPTSRPSSGCRGDSSEELDGRITVQQFVLSIHSKTLQPIEKIHFPINQWCERIVPFAKRKATIVDFTNNSCQNGSVRLKLRLSATCQRSMPNELPEADCFVTLQEVADIIHQFHANNASRQIEGYDMCATYKGELPDPSDTILDQFLTANHFPRLSKYILNLAVLLEWNVKGGPLPLNDQALFQALQCLNTNLIASPHPISFDYGKQFNFSLSTLEAEMNYYLYERSAQFLEHYFQNLPNRVTFFPPTGDGGLLTFKKSVNKFCWELCQLEVWNWVDDKPIQTLQKQIKLFVEEDVKVWFSKHFGEIATGSPSTSIQEAETLIDLLNRLYDSCRFYLNAARLFFKNFEIDYLSLVLPIMDDQIYAALDAESLSFKRYQIEYYKDLTCMQTGSRITSRLYFAVKQIVEFLSGYCDFSDYKLISYQHLFSDCINLWLHTSKSLSMDFVLKAVKEDKELVKAADDVNFTASAIHVLSVCKEICNDFMKLQLSDAEVLSLSVVKLADIVCDNVIGYGRFLYRFVKQNGIEYMTKVKLIRAANSISHVGLYTNEKLSEFLAFDNLFDCLIKQKGKNSQDYLQIKDTLQKLMASTKHVTDSLAADLIVLIVDYLRPRIEQHCKALTIKRIEKSGNFTSYVKQMFADDRVDMLLSFLEKALHGLRGSVLPELFPIVFQEIWRATVFAIRDGLHKGQQPLYYAEIYVRHCYSVFLKKWHSRKFILKSCRKMQTTSKRTKNYLKNLEEFFDGYGCQRNEIEEYKKFLRQVELRSRTTADLILNYYACLADAQLNTELDISKFNRGILRVQLGYERIINEKINVVIKIVEAVQLPPMDNDISSDPYVVVELCPDIVFPKTDYPIRRTKIKYQTLNPTFNETFQFILPQTFPLGSVLCFTVYDYDMVSAPDLEGQAFFHLGSIPLMQWGQDINEVPTVDLHLRLVTDLDCQCFQVLRERQSWDKQARSFVSDQLTLIYYKRVHKLLSVEDPLPTCTSGLHDRVKLIFLESQSKICGLFHK